MCSFESIVETVIHFQALFDEQRFQKNSVYFTWICVCVCVCNKVFTITFDTFNAIKYSIVKKSITFPMACMFFQMDFNTIACIQAACSRLNQPNTVLGNILHIIQQLVSVLDSEAKLVCSAF